MIKFHISRLIKKYLQDESLYYLRKNVLVVRNFKCLQLAMNWDKLPILDENYLYDFEYLEDLNERRLRDAEVIGSTCCNTNPKIILEIGTGTGRTTVLMSKNVPNATIFTVNIHPDEIDTGGKNVTFAPSIEDIGKYYKERSLQNINQIIANTASWEPDIGPIDIAFIDGCHDADFVYNDTLKVLKNCHKGSIILWHDFNPELILTYHWIKEVCLGIERLYSDGVLKGRILHLQDSWVGLYLVP